MGSLSSVRIVEVELVIQNYREVAQLVGGGGNFGTDGGDVPAIQGALQPSEALVEPVGADHGCGTGQGLAPRLQVAVIERARGQFEPGDARRLAPMWDEPSAKAVFEMSLVVPADQETLSNTSVVATEPVEGGKKRVRYAPTPKMSSLKARPENAEP